MTLPPPTLFDRARLRYNRERALAKESRHSFLLDEALARLFERLFDIKRSFKKILILGNPGSGLADTSLAKARAALAQESAGEPLVMDLSPKLLKNLAGKGFSPVVGSEEALPFRAQSFDLIISALGLHWVNDLPGCLAQIRHCLKPDGLFLASFFGGESLFELRSCLLEAELTQTGGASPRISPFVDIKDAGALLQRAGFALPVTDRDCLRLLYDSPFALMQELRGMGEGYALSARNKPLTRPVLTELERLYRTRFTAANGKISASFEIITLTGWAPDPSQPKPLAPGTAKADLAATLESDSETTPDSKT